MNEARLKARLVQRLRAKFPDAIVWRHEDKFTGGVPDISVNRLNRTVWIEVKVDRPGRSGRVYRLQARALMRTAGLLVRYRIGPAPLTTVVGFRSTWSRPGIDHDLVAEVVDGILL